ncbi:hipA protein [Burkholderia pseudomallei]|nr:hipA protein [Burkholderia pseudomallei]
MSARRARATRLHLWMNGLPVGYWEHARDGERLVYFDEWIGDPQGRPLSLSLTLTQVYAAPAGNDKGEVAKTAAGARARAGARRAVPPASAPAPSAAGRAPRPARKRAAPKKREDW